VELAGYDLLLYVYGAKGVMRFFCYVNKRILRRESTLAHFLVMV